MSNYYIRLLENEDWIVEYSPAFGEYRVSYFEGGHFKDMAVFKECKGGVDLTIPRTVYVPTLIKLPPDSKLHWYTMQEIGGIERKEQIDKLKYMHGQVFTNPDECKEWIKRENEKCQVENANRNL